jgi:hypothetical protein
MLEEIAARFHGAEKPAFLHNPFRIQDLRDSLRDLFGG